jgi:hypothetical protein
MQKINRGSPDLPPSLLFSKPAVGNWARRCGPESEIFCCLFAANNSENSGRASGATALVTPSPRLPTARTGGSDIAHAAPSIDRDGLRNKNAQPILLATRYNTSLPATRIGVVAKRTTASGTRIE